MQCANCDQPGAVLVDDPGSNSVVYCMVCLPVHLIPRVTAGQLQLLGQDD
jgi:hypothetical protein